MSDAMGSKTKPPPSALKYVSLVTLTVQNAVLGLSMRYARTRPGDMFLSSSAVVMSELVKLVISLGLVYQEEGNLRTTLHALHRTVIKQPIDTLKVCLPSLLYIFQNNLLYVSASHLDVATYQVTYQLKILTTALFAVVLLRKRLLVTQWLALVVLITGVVLVQLVDSTETAVSGIEQNRVLGFCAALGACFLSGFAGIYFEKILKGSDISVWMRNVQLSLLSLPFGLATCLFSDWSLVQRNGFYFGYDWFVWYLVVLQAGGGLIVAMVVKYADNILKGFATSLAIIISCVVSVYLFHFQVSWQFVLGGSLVISSIFMYGYQPKSDKDDKAKEEDVKQEVPGTTISLSQDKAEIVDKHSVYPNKSLPDDGSLGVHKSDNTGIYVITSNTATSTL